MVYPSAQVHTTVWPNAMIGYPEPSFIPLEFERLSPEEQLRRSREFLEVMQRRRTVRHFSPTAVPPLELIENAIATANTAPSGAHLQPWRFVVVRDPAVKHAIRQAAEAEERENYEHRFPVEWLQALARLGTDWRKDFLDDAPYLIVVFEQVYGLEPGPTPDAPERKIKHYYVKESVGIAIGLLIAGLHQAGLATVTHTPNPMGFLSRILNRPPNERPYLILPVGYPADGCLVPDLQRKSLSEVMAIV
jgi:iodotyrosine deiodinase